jgi:DNA-binding transcriptional LysR family regulator
MIFLTTEKSVSVLPGSAKIQAMEWSDLRVLLAIARAGTLAAAARRLGVDQTTVARRLAAAETALGTRLFERVEGALRPTMPGEVALARAGRVEREVQALEQGIAGTDAEPAGLVRLTAVPIIVNRLRISLCVCRAPNPAGRPSPSASDISTMPSTRRAAGPAIRCLG